MCDKECHDAYIVGKWNLMDKLVNRSKSARGWKGTYDDGAYESPM